MKLPNVRGLFDTTCKFCKHRFGWCGRLVDKPACPKCGKRDGDKRLLRDAERVRCVFTSVSSRSPLGPQMRVKRHQTGLSPIQAAGRLGISAVWLQDFENEKVPAPSKATIERMLDVYEGCLVEKVR